MTDSFLGKTFYSLAPQDRKALLQSVQNTLFNSRKEVVRLLEYLDGFDVGQKPAHRGANLPNKEDAFQFVYGDQKGKKASKSADYDDGKMRHLMNYALEAIRLHLAWENWQSDPTNVSLQLCNALKKRGLDELFEKEYPRALHTVNADPERSADHYLQTFLLESDAWQVHRAGQRLAEEKLQGLSDIFGTYVAINSLRQGCSILSQKVMGDRPHIIPYLQETLRLIEAGHFADSVAVQVYYNCYKALSPDGDEHNFEIIKAHLETGGQEFPLTELRDIFIMAINFCIKRLNAGQRHYSKAIFQLYKLGLEGQIFLVNGSLSPYTFYNITTIALGLGEWEWTLHYLHEFAPYLPAKDRDNIFRYTLATYYFRLPDHDRALELLRSVEFRDVLYNFDARRMLLRIYYDRKEFNALESLLDSFYLYLQRHPKAGYHRDMYLNLVRFTKKVIKLRPEEKEKWQRLREDIKATKHVAEREWLLGLIID